MANMGDDYKAAFADPSTSSAWRHQRLISPYEVKKETVIFEKYGCLCGGTVPLTAFLANAVIKPE